MSKLSIWFLCLVLLIANAFYQYSLLTIIDKEKNEFLLDSEKKNIEESYIKLYYTFIVDIILTIIIIFIFLLF